MRIRKKLLFSAFAIVLLASEIPSASAYSRCQLDMNQLTQVATQEFSKSASIMVDGYGARYASRSQDKHNDMKMPDGRSFSKAIDDYRKKLSSMGEKYSASRSSTTIDSLNHKPDGTIKALATETTYLTIDGAETETGYTARHELTFSQTSSGQWGITEDEYLEPTGLLPLGEAESLVKSDSTYFDTVSNDTSTESVEAVSIEHPDVLDSEFKTTQRAGGYNYDAMAKYLEKYWKNYNPAYRSFNDAGGDCTNFVSQALRAGGWKDKTGWYLDANNWWYNWSYQSRSWTSVEDWATFAVNSGRVSRLSDEWQLRKGDVLQVKPAGSNRRIHTMMVSHYRYRMPYFTYRTTDRYRRSLRQVLLDWPGATFYAYRT